MVSDSCDPMDCSPPGSSVHGILQARIWSGLPFPSPGDLPDPGIELRSPASQADSLLTELHGKPYSYIIVCHQTSPQTINKKKKNLSKLFIPGSRNHLRVNCVAKESTWHIVQSKDRSDDTTLFTVQTRRKRKQSTSSPTAQEPECGNLCGPSQMNSNQTQHSLPSSNIDQVPGFLLLVPHT